MSHFKKRSTVPKSALLIPRHPVTLKQCTWPTCGTLSEYGLTRPLLRLVRMVFNNSLLTTQSQRVKTTVWLYWITRTGGVIQEHVAKSDPRASANAIFRWDIIVVFNNQWNTYKILGTAVAQWLRCCATNRKVAGSIPAGVNGIFHWHKILPIALWPWGRLSL